MNKEAYTPRLHDQKFSQGGYRMASAESTPGANPSPPLTECLLNRRLLQVEDTFPSSSLSEVCDPFGPTNLAAAAPPPQVMEAQRPILYRTQMPSQEIQAACVSMYGNSDKFMIYDYSTSPDGGQTAALTVKHPSGASRKYVTEAASSKRKDAREAVSRLALDMGVIDFLQTGDDQKHLDRARANGDGEVSDDFVNTLGGKVYYLNVENVEPSPAVAEIEECCQTWRTAKVFPHWLTFGHSYRSMRFGAMLQIRLTPESTTPSFVKVYATAPEYSHPDIAKNNVAELAVRKGVLDFIKFGNGQQRPNEGPQAAIPPLVATGETVGQRKRVDPLSLPRPTITIQQWAEALPQPFPHNIKLENGSGGMNAIAWVNQVANRKQVPICYSRVHSPNGRRVGCILRAGGGAGLDEQSWFVDALFGTWQEARLAVCLDAVSRGGYDEFMNNLGLVVKDKMKAEQNQQKLEQQKQRLEQKRLEEQGQPTPAFPPKPSRAQSQAPVDVKVTLARIREECSNAGLPPPKLEFQKGLHGVVSSATLTINVGEDAHLSYSAEGQFANAEAAEIAVVEKAAKGGLIDFLTPFVATQSNGGQSNAAETSSSKRKKKGKKKKKTQGDANSGSPDTSVSRNEPPIEQESKPVEPEPSRVTSGVIWPVPTRPVVVEVPKASMGSARRDIPSGSGDFSNRKPRPFNSGYTVPVTGANMTPLPPRKTPAAAAPVLKREYGPPSSTPVYPNSGPSAANQPPIYMTHRPEVSQPRPPLYHERLPGPAYHRTNGPCDEVGGYEPFRRDTMYSEPFVREPGEIQPQYPRERRRSPPRQWDGYNGYSSAPADVKGKGRAVPDYRDYRGFTPPFVEEGEMMDRKMRYAPPQGSYQADDRRQWYAERSYEDHPSPASTGYAPKRPYSAYDEDAYGERSKRARWGPSVPDLPPSGW